MKKNNFSFIIREATLKDAAAFLKLRNQTEKETTTMGYRGGERKTTVEQIAGMIQRVREIRNKSIFVAEIGDTLVGFIMIYGQDMEVYSRTRSLAIGVLKKYWRKGIGTALMEQGIEWAKKNKTHRLELDVWDYNTPAINLYKKFKFKKEGVQKEGIYINKKYVDILNMGLILDK